MVQCAAFNCYVQSGQGLSMYKFPKDPKLRKIWTEKLKRDHFTPSNHTKLCKRHFINEDFAVNPKVLKSVNFTPYKQKKLKPDAIPSVFEFSTPKRKVAVLPKRTSQAHEKRRRLEIISELLNTEMETSRSRDSPQQMEVLNHIDKDQAGLDHEDENQTAMDHQMPEMPRKEAFSVTTQTSYRLVDRRNVSIDTNLCECNKKLLCKSQGTQTETEHEIAIDSATGSLNNSFIDDNSDPDWTPSFEDSDIGDYSDDSCDDSPATEKKFIVFESCLDKLFEKCAKCGSDCRNSKKVLGTFVQVTSFCDNCFETKQWDSQPRSDTMPFGNLILAGAILFSGSSPNKVLTLLRHAAICAMSISTFMNIQSLYLVPTITSVWQNKQQQLFSYIRELGTKVIVGGDGRCCSPGHTAKYGTYSLMDLKTSKILDI